jgi:hypothetical protein
VFLPIQDANVLFLARKLREGLLHSFLQVPVLRLVNPAHLLLERRDLAAQVNNSFSVLLRGRLETAGAVGSIAPNDGSRIDLVFAEQFLASLDDEPIGGAVIHVSLVRMGQGN